MIEIDAYFDIKDNADSEEYAKIAQELAVILKDTQGFIEIRSYKVVAGSSIRWKAVVLWKTLADWAALTETRKYQKLMNRRAKVCSHVKYEVWMEANPLTE
ncbi:MAG TPA: hypothetical protein VKK79_17280 [Candidatus Lokiarchaeia archaeon]|nr:hypothetical protein [Candidatus Lokiarchaeia archaeon]